MSVTHTHKRRPKKTRRRGGVDTHRIQRSLAAMTTKTALAMRQQDERRETIGAGEFLHIVKVPVGGKAGGVAAYKKVYVPFDTPFYPAPDRRDSEFDTPVMTFGVEMDSPDPVQLWALVQTWDTDADGLTKGAYVQIGIAQPGADQLVDFSAQVVLLFQGWTAPAIDDDEG